MSEPAILPPGRPSSLLTVTQLGPRGMLTLRGDLDSAAMKQAVQAAVGLPVPARRRIVLAEHRGAGWMSPDELLLLMPHDAASAALKAAQDALQTAHALVVDVSEARASFRLSGRTAAEALARLAPVDMAALAPDELRRTRLAQIPAAFWRSDADSFDVVCFTSVARYAHDLLANAAASPPVGYFAGS